MSVAPLYPVPINEPGKWKCMISYKRGESDALAERLYSEINNVLGLPTWMDLRMKDRGPDAMKEGVGNSELVIVLLSPSYT